MIDRLHHNNNGFTFIEVAVTMIILLVSGTALYIMFHQGEILMAEQEHRRTVFELAQKRMSAFQFLSEYHNPSYGIIVLEPGVTRGEEVLEIGVEDDEETQLIANYEIEVEESDLGDYVIVSVKYDWVARSGREYNITLKDIYPYTSP